MGGCGLSRGWMWTEPWADVDGAMGKCGRWWADAYFMAMGTFARIGSIMRDRRFHDKSFAMYARTFCGCLGAWPTANAEGGSVPQI